MATGANATPLGNTLSALRGRNSGGHAERIAAIETAKRIAASTDDDVPVKKKKRSRWGTTDSKIIVPGLPTVLPSNLTEEHQRMYLIHLQIEDASRKLRTSDLGIPSNLAERSPSPEPIYSHDGKRLNTREVRVRKRLEDDRHRLVQEALKINPEYKPPADYKAQSKKFEDKVYIPQDDHPETNFVGLIIGPRGVTLKQLETDTGTKIMIRGKGAQKDGKKGNIPQPGDDEPLHALITATTPELLKIGVDKVKSIVKSGIENPGNDNEIKKMQMMQLAQMNGTLRPQDIIFRWKSGIAGTAEYEAPSLTSQIICSRCGGGGHIASDCKVDLSGIAPVDTTTAPMGVADRAKMDSEYLSLMKELGEVVPGGSSASTSSKIVSVNPVTVGAAIPPPSSLQTTAVKSVNPAPFVPLPVPGQVPAAVFGAMPFGGPLLPMPPGPMPISQAGTSGAPPPPWQQATAAAFAAPFVAGGLLPPPPFGMPPMPPGSGILPNPAPPVEPTPPPGPVPPLDPIPPPPGTSTV